MNACMMGEVVGVSRIGGEIERHRNFGVLISNHGNGPERSKCSFREGSSKLWLYGQHGF